MYLRNEAEMYSSVMTGADHGVSSYLLRVETNISNGLPAFNMVGFMSSDVETIYPVICSMGQKPHNYAVFWPFQYGGHIFWRPIVAVFFGKSSFA